MRAAALGPRRTRCWRDALTALRQLLRSRARSAASTVAIIAEVKRCSPSKGAINPGLDAVAQARAYERRRGGGHLRSHRAGTVRWLARRTCGRSRAACAVPLLQKDFHVDPSSCYEARALGASAALLIARAVAPPALRGAARRGTRDRPRDAGRGARRGGARRSRSTLGADDHRRQQPKSRDARDRPWYRRRDSFR